MDLGDALPFYQVVNALAHLDLTDADHQLEIAFKRLIADQEADGSWSGDQPE